jgi:hypothetical protein
MKTIEELREISEKQRLINESSELVRIRRMMERTAKAGDFAYYEDGLSKATVDILRKEGFSIGSIDGAYEISWHVY